MKKKYLKSGLVKCIHNIRVDQGKTKAKKAVSLTSKKCGKSALVLVQAIVQQHVDLLGTGNNGFPVVLS